MNKNSNKTKVFVGLSGGVDSSVSAALLLEQGFDVTGVFIKAWHPKFLPCNWRKEMRDAMRVCAKLKIPFLLCDLEKEYKKEVIDYLISEYSLGRTPNPDVFCNKEIKFGHFMNWALELGADFVATGHYAQSINDNETAKMLCSADTNKDQTYFLWTLPESKIKKIKFPIGHLEKKEVRKIAKKYHLHTSTKKDSQGLCFVGHVDMKLFLKRFIKTTPGEVLDQKGQIIGIHEGSQLYTIGQRHGFKINKNDTEKPNYYVSGKDIAKNQITVVEMTEKKEQDSEIIPLMQVNLTQDKLYELNKIEIEIKPRYRSKNYRATLIKKDSQYFIEKNEPIEKIALGQSIVFYRDNECLGGGVVK